MPVPSVGRKAPGFELMSDAGTSFRLSSQLGSPVVLFFYPEDLTEGCTIENVEFSALASEFEDLGVIAAGISPDSFEKHCKFREKHDLRLPLLADERKKVAKAYGVWGPKKMFGHEYEGVIRTTFLIDARGKIAQVWKVTRIKGHARQVLEASRALAPAPSRSARAGR